MKAKTILVILLVTTSGAVFSPEVVQGTIVEFGDDRTIHDRDEYDSAFSHADGWRPSVGWTSGHHVILDGDVYGEIWMYNDARATMFGGEAYKLESFGTTAFDMLNGEMELLYVHDNSTARIYGGSVGGLGATENAVIELYAYDIIHHATGGRFDRGWVEGRYFADDSYFSFDLNHLDTFLHINAIPEPTTLLLFGLGSWIVKRRN